VGQARKHALSIAICMPQNAWAGSARASPNVCLQRTAKEHERAGHRRTRMAPAFAASLLGCATCGWSNCQSSCWASDGASTKRLRMRCRPPASPCIRGGHTLSCKSARMHTGQFHAALMMHAAHSYIARPCTPRISYIGMTLLSRCTRLSRQRHGVLDSLANALAAAVFAVLTRE
jgi:hypothetical protein